MDNKEKEDLIDKLLVYMNDDIERIGRKTNHIYFNFSKDQEDYNIFMKKHPVSDENLKIALNTCISRNYIKEYYGGGPKNMYQLTEEGQGRAISFCNADEKVTENTGNITIGSINSSGAVQIGNYNTQNIENVLTAIIDSINNTTASEEEKQEAKSLLNKFLTHPLVNTLLGAAANAATALIQG